jgi:transposase
MMILFEDRPIYLYSQPIDMRKSINGLSYIVSDLSNSSLQDGSLTLFYNRARDKVKLLYWDKNGYVLIYKRLEKGRFKILKYDGNTEVATLDNKQLSWLLAGLDYDLMAQNKSLDYSGFY